MASRVIFSNFFEEQSTLNPPQYLSGMSRELFPTTFLEIAVYITSDSVTYGSSRRRISSNRFYGWTEALSGISGFRKVSARFPRRYKSYLVQCKHSLILKRVVLSLYFRLWEERGGGGRGTLSTFSKTSRLDFGTLSARGREMSVLRSPIKWGRKGRDQL